MRSRSFSGPALLLLTGGLSACRESPPPPTVATPASAPATAAPAPATAAPAPGLGARLRYSQSGTIEPPPEMAALLPPGLAAKVVERQRGRGMILMRLAPTQRRASLVLLTLEPQADLQRALATHLGTLGFTPAPGAPGTYTRPNGERLGVALTVDPDAPLRAELTLDGPEDPKLPTPPALAAEIAPDPARLGVVGFEEGRLHAVSPGNTDTDVSRTAYILRAKTAEDRQTALAAWTAAVEKAGFKPRPGRAELWERPATRELLVIRPTDAPTGDVLVSHQRRWRR